ncbi:unnamed protein product [Caenorhabditis bovis]|uniref:Chitin-binding type-2 domain-containing protein n=1 Tax=Caenorhabditis bovis TaxID=2654633 RepID=A0A8S1EAD6_9PELO|nr:unnamed protein product [Caenorhabditis bovis]
MIRLIALIACLIVNDCVANLMEMAAVAEGPISPNYCNNSELLDEAGLIRATLGQFLGYDCSEEFYHCRWQSDGYRTYRKKCKPGLVYDVSGTQNCNYDYNVKSCGIRSGGPTQCNATDFHCSLSEQCVPMSARCDGHYDCGLEEDEQNCPLCTAGEFACKVSEQCIPIDRRCNGLVECDDGTDERDCDVCGHGLFHCSKSNECIPMDERCDGRRQCPHGEDEMLCKKLDVDKKFMCQSRDYEIAFNQVCDGVPQCPDNSDEAYCDVPKIVGGITFSSKPVNELPPPAPAPKVVEEEDDEDEYEYEEVQDEKPAPFPMLPIINLPKTAAVTTTTTTTTTHRPPLAPRQRTVKPAFSRPRPKINNVMEARTTQAQNFVQPTFVDVTSPPATPATATTRYPTRPVSSGRPSVTRKPLTINSTGSPAISRRPDVAPIATSRHARPNEKVFIMQVTASPRATHHNAPPIAPTAKSSASHEIGSSAASTGTTHQSGEESRMASSSSSRQDLLKQIAEQLNGGMNEELLAKIETIINSESAPTREAHRRRKPTR